MNRVDASQAAHELIQMMKPFLDRTQIAGSIRRKKEFVKDIEIVGIPKIAQNSDMFGQVIETYPMTNMESFIERLDGWEFDEVLKRNGPKYKRLFNPELDICCDLFLTNLRRWGYQITIRTGPANFSKMVVIKALEKGWHFTDSLLHKHPKTNGKVCPKGESCPLIFEVTNEEGFFDALGLPWIDPKDRR